MSYEDVEAAVLTQMAQVEELSPETVISGDYKLLAKGVEYAAVVRYRAFTTNVELRMGGDVEYNWTVSIILCVKYDGTDEKTYDKVRRLRQNVLDRFAQYPYLGIPDEVFYAFMQDGETPFEESLSGMINFEVGSHKYHRELIRLRVREEVGYDILG